MDVRMTVEPQFCVVYVPMELEKAVLPSNEFSTEKLTDVDAPRVEGTEHESEFPETEALVA